MSRGFFNAPGACACGPRLDTLRNMRRKQLVAGLAGALAFAALCQAKKDDASKVRKVIERSTLNQPGTKPFHLRATIAPSRADRGAERTGDVEIWWTSPTQWRREVRSPDFHQIDIVNGGRESQKNEGDYFPEWLRETAVALIDPVPYPDQALKMVNEADVKTMFGSTYYSWMSMSSDGTVEKGMGATIAITDATGLLFYCGDLGWGGRYKDYKGFHGRMVGRTVTHGTPEVTARITILEDLREAPAGLFEAGASGDAPLLKTVIVDEKILRKNLLVAEPVTWPPLKDGPLEGLMTTSIVVDRSGKVREIGTIVTDNNAMSDAARQIVGAMQFKPYLQDGVPVQVVSRITMPFKAARPGS
jgi:Gram-negative bacterial TonB protein C-terminal